MTVPTNVYNLFTIKSRIRDICGASIFSIPEGDLSDLINIEIANSLPKYISGHSNFLQRVRIPLLPYRYSYSLPDGYDFIRSPILLDGTPIKEYRAPFYLVDDGEYFDSYPMKTVILNQTLPTEAQYIADDDINIIPGYTFIYAHRIGSNTTDKASDTSWSFDSSFSDMYSYEDYKWNAGDVQLTSQGNNPSFRPSQGLVNYNNGFIRASFLDNIPSFVQIRAKFAYVSKNSGASYIVIRQSNFSVYPILREGAILEAIALKKHPPLMVNSDMAKTDAGEIIIALTALRIFKMYEPLRIPEGEKLLQDSLDTLNNYDSNISAPQERVRRSRGR